MGSPFRTINSLSKGIEVDTINPRREGGPDIQCHGSFGELDPSILDVAIAGYRGVKGSRCRRLFDPAICPECPSGAVFNMDPELHFQVKA